MSALSSPLPPLSRDHALFLDFDGTLAPLQDDADAVCLSTNREAQLSRLADALDGALALISGRDIGDLARRTPKDVHRVGNHGLYDMSAGETVPPLLDDLPLALQDGMADLARSADGAWLEIKGPVGTLHFRQVAGPTQRLIEAVRTLAASTPGYNFKLGNGVAEAIPHGASKGRAIDRFMIRAPFMGRTPIMVGDDTTDEDGFLAVQRLGGRGVKVGPGETVARSRLEDVDAVWAWLETLQ